MGRSINLVLFISGRLFFRENIFLPKGILFYMLINWVTPGLVPPTPVLFLNSVLQHVPSSAITKIFFFTKESSFLFVDIVGVHHDGVNDVPIPR